MTTGSVELTDAGGVVVVISMVVVGLVGIGVEGATGSSPPGIISEVPLPGTPLVELVIVVVDRLPPIPPSVFVSKVLDAGGSVKLVKDVPRVPPSAPAVT